MSGPIQNGFQGLVNNQPGVGEAGDFYGTNIRAVVLAGPGAFVSPSEQLTVGNFCWADTDTGDVSQSEVAGYQLAFVGRSPNQAVITAFLAPSTYLINAGFPVTLHSQGDFWGLFAGGATPGQNVYADPATGALIAGSSTPNAVVGTGSVGAAFTGVVATNVLTASAVTGYLTPGDLINSASITNGVLGAQLTGPAGGAGTYTLVHADVSSEAMTDTSTILDVTAVSSGAFGVGDVVTGPSGSPTITAQLSGTPGGIGFYQLSGSPVHYAPGAVTVGGVLTAFKVNSVAAAGELAKISSWG